MAPRVDLRSSPVRTFSLTRIGNLGTIRSVGERREHVVIGQAASFILSALIGAIVELPIDLITYWAAKAAEKNAKEFETADANSMNAWKHFPW
jgi:hypothetical protein